MATSRKPTKTAAKKTAAKKTAAKKTATKKSSGKKTTDFSAPRAATAPGAIAPTVIMSSNLDLMDPDFDPTLDLHDDIRNGLDQVAARSKTRQVSFLTPAQMVKTIIPFPDLTVQHALNSRGIRAGTAVEIIAPEHVGKTTLAFEWMGTFGLQGCPSLYLEGEGKPMDPNRMIRCLHTNPKIAEKLMRMISFAEPRTLLEAEYYMDQWLPEARARADKHPQFAGKPLIVVIDPWSRLMGEGEAAGYSDFGVSKGAKVVKKETGKSSNLQHSKYAHAWCRRLPSTLRKYNVLLIIINHQNEHIDMGYSPVGVSDQKNDTTIGGKAFAQLCAYRFTLTSYGHWATSDRTVIGLYNRLFVLKNSYGPKFRGADIRLQFENHNDTPDSYGRVVHHSHATADFLVKHGLLNARMTDKLYTCEELGCTAVTAEELHEALYARPHIVEWLGDQLRIEGYAQIGMQAEQQEESEEMSAEEMAAAQQIEAAIHTTAAVLQEVAPPALPPPPPGAPFDPMDSLQVSDGTPQAAEPE